MHQPASQRTPLSLIVEVPPLTLPLEVWTHMSSQEQDHYRAADRILEILTRRTHSAVDSVVGEIQDNTDLGPEDIGEGCKILLRMNLVKVENSGKSLVLIAEPEDHIAIRSPDGSRRWVFVAKPMVEREVAKDLLN